MARNRFEPLREYSGSTIKKGLIDNSQTLAVGEVIIPGVQGDVAVVLTGGGTTGALLGAVLGIEGKDGKILELDSYVAEADNVTDKMVNVSYLPFFVPMEWAGTLDAAAETTDNSGAYGTFAVDSTGLLVDESTVTAFSTVIAKQFFSYGIVPGTTTEVTGVFTKMIGHTA